MSIDPPRFDGDHNIIELAGKRLVFHCHHYNLFLQRTIEDALGSDGVDVQVAAAGEAARTLLGGLFATDGGVGLADRLQRAGALFSSLGFGAAALDGVSEEGGLVHLITSHYALGWRGKFGVASRPVCHFAVGFWTAALTAAATLTPERVRGRELACAATGAPACQIEIEVR